MLIASSILYCTRSFRRFPPPIFLNLPNVCVRYDIQKYITSLRSEVLSVQRARKRRKKQKKIKTTGREEYGRRWRQTKAACYRCPAVMKKGRETMRLLHFSSLKRPLPLNFVHPPLFQQPPFSETTKVQVRARQQVAVLFSVSPEIGRKGKMLQRHYRARSKRRRKINNAVYHFPR